MADLLNHHVTTLLRSEHIRKEIISAIRSGRLVAVLTERAETINVAYIAIVYDVVLNHTYDI